MKLSHTFAALALGIALASCNGEATKPTLFADIKLDQDPTYAEDEEGYADRVFTAVVYFDEAGTIPPRRVDLLSQEADSILLCPPDDGYTSLNFIEAINASERWSEIPDPYEWAYNEDVWSTNPCKW